AFKFTCENHYAIISRMKYEKRGFIMKQSIYSLTFEDLQAWLIEAGEKKFRAKQVWHWLYEKRVKTFSQMNNVNNHCLSLLEAHFNLGTMDVELKQESKDGTIKFLFKLSDGQLVETVLMKHHYGHSVCVTTQVGCNIGCSFCASGILRKNRDLTAGEIVEQIMQVQMFLDERGKDERVSHIVVMGIGEPFDNFDNLVVFLKNVNDQRGLSIGA